jgi:hypothetical protein
MPSLSQEWERMATRIAWIYALFAVLTCSENAHANETWTCIRKFEDGQRFSSEIVIAEDQLTFKGGKGGYTIFDNNQDHVRGVNKGDATFFYIPLERVSGRMTEFSTIFAFGGISPTSFHSDCTREK